MDGTESDGKSHKLTWEAAAYQVLDIEFQSRLSVRELKMYSNNPLRGPSLLQSGAALVHGTHTWWKAIYRN